MHIELFMHADAWEDPERITEARNVIFMLIRHGYPVARFYCTIVNDNN